MEQNTSCEMELHHCDTKKTDTCDLKVIEVEVLKDIKDSKEENIEVCIKNPEEIESQHCDKKMTRRQSSSSKKSKKYVWPFTKNQAKAQIALVLVLLAIVIIAIVVKNKGSKTPGTQKVI